MRIISGFVLSKGNLNFEDSNACNFEDDYRNMRTFSGFAPSIYGEIYRKKNRTLVFILSVDFSVHLSG